MVYRHSKALLNATLKQQEMQAKTSKKPRKDATDHKTTKGQSNPDRVE